MPLVTPRQSENRFFSKPRVALFAIAAAYAALMLLNLGFNSLRWDELVHCLGGWQLLNGHFMEYLTTNTFYPPMFNLAVAAFFSVGGASALTARLVAVAFSVLSLFVLFELADRLYGARVALLATVLFAVMPGVVWASRLAYIETMLEFFFLLALFFFFSWLRTDRRRDLLLGGLVLGLGFLVKYQALVAGLVMLATLLVLGRNYFRARLTRFSILLLLVAAVAASWFAVTYLFAPATLNQWVYAISTGDQLKSMYSVRFPTPVFYLVEMTWPFSFIHPISLPLYMLGFVGLTILAWRRKAEDKFLLVWFAVVYVVFTLVGNREWRYVLPLFPVLAVSASTAASFIYSTMRKSWQTATRYISRVSFKLAAALLIAFTVGAVVISCSDTNYWLSQEQVNVPVQEAVTYVAARTLANESMVLICPFALFSGGMADFYLQTMNKQITVLQYPRLPTDTFTPTFNVSELVSLCQQNNVKYILLSEHHWTATYFNSTLTPQDVGVMVYATGQFCNQTSVGEEPDRIFILTFN